MAAESDTGDNPENEVFEVGLRWVIPPNVASRASTERRSRVIMESLRDTTVVITGASSGIGLATAKAFARRGANVVLAARRRELLEQAAQDCEALGDRRALAVPTDVTDPAQVRQLAGAAASAFGGIDVWVNNAGTSMWGSFEDIPLESQLRLIELNLLGAIYGCHAALPYFFDRGGRGVIINVSSIFGRVPMPWAAGYTASKAGLAGFTEALRFELSSHSGIEVCAVYPAYVDTPTYLNSANYTGRADRWAGAAATPDYTRRRSTRLGRPVRARARPGRTLSGEVGQALLVSFGASGGCVGRRPARDSRRESRSSRRLGDA